MNRCHYCSRLLKHISLVQYGSRDKEHTEKCDHCRITFITRMREWMGVWQVQNRNEKRPTVNPQ